MGTKTAVAFANIFTGHQTIKFTAEVSETQTHFLDTTVCKGKRFKTESVLEVRTHFKPTETFQYTHFSACRPSGVNNNNNNNHHHHHHQRRGSKITQN